jgi:hypothetical protein
MKPSARDAGEEVHMKTTILLVAAAAVVLGPVHGLAQANGDATSEDRTRCDVSNPEGTCRPTPSEIDAQAKAQAKSVPGAGSGEPVDPPAESSMLPGNDGTAGGP